MATTRPAKVTSQMVERNIQARRNIEVQKREYMVFSDENSKLLYTANAQEKIEARRRLAQQQQVTAAQQQEERAKQDHYNRRMNQLEKSQNAALAQEMEREATDEERRAREIQRICEEAPELRDLERALKVAYMNKDRAAQHQEKIMLAQAEQQRLQAIEEQMEFDRQRAIKADAIKLKQQKELSMKQREVLQRQIQEREEQLAQAQLQAEEDKRMVEEIIRKINEEDDMEYRVRKERQAATAKMVREYEEQRQRELAERKAREKAEEDRILEYIKHVDSRNEGVAAKKQAKKDEEDRILARIVEETERKRKEEEEFNNLRDMLWEEELEAKKRQDEEARKQKLNTMRREMMQANADMMVSKAERRKLEAEAEARMVELMKKKFAEDEAKERAEEEARRQAKMQHMSLIEKQRHDRRTMYEAEKQLEQQEVEAARQREEYRRKVIQEARKRLLEEHAARLEGYMPDGVFSNKEEYSLFKQAAGSHK